jgi:site-specific recombinase XerD
MKLSEAAANYVAHKQSIGMRFRTEARTLKSFCGAMGKVSLQRVSPDRVHAYLAGTGPVTRFWERKHSVLDGFYRFAIGRGHVASSPLPRTVPKPLQTFVPYIYSHEELERLLSAVVAHDNPRGAIDPTTFRLLLLLLYGAGLRISEALGLTLADIDLTAAVLHVRESKFYKTRLVPIGFDLIRLLTPYATTRRRNHATPDSPFFVSRRGDAVTRSNAENAFCRLRVRAGVMRDDGNPRHQPRLHDLRATFAVHRLISWYRSGADLQRLLPQLSTYLGHINIQGTQRYLTLTPELLREASDRFERYAWGPPHE